MNSEFDCAIDMCIMYAQYVFAVYAPHKYVFFAEKTFPPSLETPRIVLFVPDIMFCSSLFHQSAASQAPWLQQQEASLMLFGLRLYCYGFIAMIYHHQLIIMYDRPSLFGSTWFNTTS